MCTLELITKELKKQKKTQKDLCDFLHLTKNSFTEWKGGRSVSYQKHLPRIAEYLHVSVDYLLGSTDDPTPPGAKKKPSETEDITFDDFTFALYREARELTERQKEELLNMARYMKAAKEKEKRGDK